jgi:hypothetical protein
LRRAWNLAVVISLLGGSALAAEAGTTCRTSHNLVGACFTVHGRLFEADVPPRIRIDATGGKQILGVLDRQSLTESAEMVPAAANALLMAAPSTTDIYGDYEVCPFEKDTSGPMRAVCIQSATHVVARQR